MLGNKKKESNEDIVRSEINISVEQISKKGDTRRKLTLKESWIVLFIRFLFNYLSITRLFRRNLGRDYSSLQAVFSLFEYQVHLFLSQSSKGHRVFALDSFHFTIVIFFARKFRNRVCNDLGGIIISWIIISHSYFYILPYLENTEHYHNLDDQKSNFFYYLIGKTVSQGYLAVDTFFVMKYNHKYTTSTAIDN